MQAVTDPGEGEKRPHSQAKIIHVRDNAQREKYIKCFASSVGGTFGGGGAGTLHMKVVGMLVVLLRGVHFVFWSHLGCSGQNAIIFSCEGLV